MSVVEIRKFGEALASRSEGREAGLSTLAYDFEGMPPDEVTLDFNNVLIMTPSWLGEYVQTLMSRGVKKINYINTSPVVDSSIEFISEEI